MDTQFLSLECMILRRRFQCTAAKLLLLLLVFKLRFVESLVTSEERMGFHHSTMCSIILIGFAILRISSGMSNGTGNGSTTASPSSSRRTFPTTMMSSSSPSQSPTTSKDKNTTTMPVPTGCSSHRNCEECIDNYKCYWCGPSKSCEKWPENEIRPGSCSGNKWYWKQCTVPG